MLTLGLRSLWNRRFVALLTILSIALSVALILGTERLRSEARTSFANSASGLDLIVAGRGSSVQILMATVFGVGSTGAGISWDSFEMIKQLPQVAWAVPISMGDNHRGYPVIGTRAEYFKRFRHSGGQALRFSQGGVFADAAGAVIGADVAKRFGYVPGTVIVNAHGAGTVAFDVHDEAPFTVSGVLEQTGTAVDRMVFVSLEGFDALHAEREAPPADPFEMSAGADKAVGHNDNQGHPAEKPHAGDGDHDRAHGTEEPQAGHDHHGHEPKKINAILVGLTDRTASLAVQRLVSEYPNEALTAVLPNLALLELWSITSTAEGALRLMAWAVALAGLTGMVVMLSATLEARRREFAILRSVGATPVQVLGLIVIEAFLLSLTGILLGVAICVVAILIADPILSARFGIRMGYDAPNLHELTLVGIILCAGMLASLIPAFRVYRMTLADGLSVKL